jgi:hypothetical protein
MSQAHAQQKEPTVKFRVELVWKDNEKQAASIYLTSDGRVILQGAAQFRRRNARRCRCRGRGT